MNLLRATVLVLLLVVLSACGNSKSTTDLTPPSSESTLAQAPDWFMTPPDEDNVLLAPAVATSRSMQVAINSAQLQGRGELATILETDFDGLGKRFQEEIGVGEDSELLQFYQQTYQSVVKTVLVGSRARERTVVAADGGVYRAYVLMELPLGTARRELIDRIRANEKAYTRLRAAEAFKEMERKTDLFKPNGPTGSTTDPEYR